MTSSLGTKIETLRWAGPSFIVDGAGWGIASRSTEVVLAHVTAPSNDLVISRLTASGEWPPVVEPVVRHPTNAPHLVTEGAYIALGPEREVVLAAWGFGFATTLVEGAAVTTSPAIQVAVSTSAHPTLFSLCPDGASVFVERRARVSFAARAEELMRFKTARRTSHKLCALHDGCAVLVHEAGSPLVIRHIGEATKPRKLRSKIVPVGEFNFLVPRPDGAWLVSGTATGKPTEVHTLVGPDLVPHAPPHVLPLERFDRPLGACAVGRELAILVGGAAYSVVLTDGVTSRRTEGSIGFGLANMREQGIAADPSNDAVWVMLRQGHKTGLARVDILRTGDARLALPAYSDPAPLTRAPEPAPPRLEHSLAHYVRHVRLHHLIRAISAVHHPVLGVEHGMKRDGDTWRTWSMNGSGNHHLVAWNDSALVALAFDQDEPPQPTAELLENLPPSAAQLAKALLTSRLPKPNDVQWVIRAARRDVLGGSLEADELAGYTSTTERALEQWTELYGVSADHAALALRLADAPVGHTLSADDIAIVLSPLESGAPGEDGIALGRARFDEIEIVWQREAGEGPSSD